MKRLLHLTIMSLLFMGATVVGVVPVAAALGVQSTAGYVADAKMDACAGIDLTGGPGNCGDQGAKVSTLLVTIVNILSAVVGVAAVIMVIVSGFRFITSGGDPSAVSGAKKGVVYAIVSNIPSSAARVWSTGFPLRKRCHRRQ